MGATETNSHESIRRIQTTATHLNNLLKRVPSRRHDIREKEAHQLTQASLISRIACVCPYLHLRKAELEKIISLLLTVWKQPLVVPKWTNSDRLLALGIHNMAEEIIEAQLWSQMIRLSGTDTGEGISAP